MTISGKTSDTVKVDENGQATLKIDNLPNAKTYNAGVKITVTQS